MEDEEKNPLKKKRQREGTHPARKIDGCIKIAAVKAFELQQNFGFKLIAAEKVRLPPVLATNIAERSLVS